MALHTLRKMAEGGIYDQLGGGFCRYSVDERWVIPHFEKMLYDNGPLLALYADAWALTGEPLFRRVARGIAGWADARDAIAAKAASTRAWMRIPNTRKASSTCGRRDSAASLLSAEEYAVAAAHLRPGPAAQLRRHALASARCPAAGRHRAGAALPAGEQARALLDSARQKLFAARETARAPGARRKDPAAGTR